MPRYSLSSRHELSASTSVTSDGTHTWTSKAAQRDSCDGPSPSRRPIAKLEDFQLIRVLGKGHAGKVLLVKHTPTNAVRAMKAVSKRSVLAYGELYHTLAEQSILRRFATSEPHNRFVSRLYHSFTDKENFYFVMEFHPGGDLATQMEIHGVLGDHRTRFYAADIVQGLEDLHRHGIINRDLKPENILLNAHGHAVLADFGLSKEFGYRGSPEPVYVVLYPGQICPPSWAGAGAGSLRKDSTGGDRITIDRAYSFVGTAEYIAPEVVQRGEYSYAVDWWALGCIMLESLIGQVPFKRRDSEPVVELWTKILTDPWERILNSHTEALIDNATWELLDALLQKDPMWRITEPAIKAHRYFDRVDWDAVRKGEYEDPYKLELDPVAEYNTNYFPKLCLEEYPTVDMTGHDGTDATFAPPTPLNDNELYLTEQEKYRLELETFAWSREEAEWNYQAVLENGSEESSLREAMRATDTATAMKSEDLARLTDSVVIAAAGDPLLPPETISDTDEDTGGTPALMKALPSVSLDTRPGVAEEGELDATIDKALKPLPKPPMTPSSPKLASPATPPVTSPTSQVTTSPIRSPKSIASVAPVPIPLGPRLARQLSPELHLPSCLPSSGLSVSEIMSIRSLRPGTPDRLIRRHATRASIDTLPIARLSVELNGSITRLDDEEWEEVSLPDGDDASSPNGYGSGIGPHSFFSRLRHRPSTLVGSGLRRQTRISVTSSRGSSPTKPHHARTAVASRSIERTKRAIEKIKTFPKFRSLSPDKPAFEGQAILNKRDDNIIPFRSGHRQPYQSSLVESADSTDGIKASRARQRTSSAIHDGWKPPSPPRPPMAARRYTELGWLDQVRLSKTSSELDQHKRASLLPIELPVNPRNVLGKNKKTRAPANDPESSTGGSSSERSVSSSNVEPPQLVLDEMDRMDLSFDPDDWTEKEA
ncbi:hypothetical protein IAU60_005262 [Kwoniella sp. DSM 27419]